MLKLPPLSLNKSVTLHIIHILNQGKYKILATGQVKIIAGSILNILLMVANKLPFADVLFLPIY